MYKVISTKLGLIDENLNFEQLIQLYIDIKNNIGATKLSQEYMFLEIRKCKKHGIYEQNIKNKIINKLYPSSGNYIIYDMHKFC